MRRRLIVWLEERAERALNDGVNAAGFWRSERLRRQFVLFDRVLARLEREVA